jgi:outer membrane receptor protein involved in Fe transport
MLNTYRSRLLASTLFASAALAASPAFAQESDPASQPKTGVQSSDSAAPAAGVSSQESAPPAAANSAGEIVVTGTLIRNPNLISSSPVAVIGQEEIQLRQKNNAEEILRDLPGVTPSIGSAVNNGNAGASYADLRGLGNFRNIVLLDGARIAPSGLVGRVDLNNIPLALVERVDTLTGGAATTYGADAVSGVINFITRSDFSGIEASVSNQITERGDGNYLRADLTIGANFDDGRGNAVFSIGYQQADPVYQGARDFSRNNYTSTSGGLGGSGTTIPSRFTNSALGTGVPTDPNDPNYLSANRILNPATGGVRGYVASRDAFNFNPYNIFQTPFERFNMYGAGHYEISDNVEVYSRGLYSKNTVTTVLAPAGLFGESVTINLNNPYLPAVARSQFCALNIAPVNAEGTRTSYVPRFTPAECAAAAVATGPTDPNYRTVNSTVARRTTEAGSRITDYTTQVFDYRAGIKVGLSESIGLDVTGAYGESQNDQVIGGYLRSSRIRQAALANSTTACVDPSNGCVPINLFGPEGSLTPDMLAFVTADSSVVTKTSLAQARALLSGDFGATLPWASEPIGFAAGTEYRKYRASQTADILSQQAGELSGTGGATPNISGGYEVVEGYGELIAPIVADAPFFKSLTLEAGVRYSDYKVFAPSSPSYSSTTYKGGGSWEPVDGIKIRGNYQRAVRAPNISELFSPQNTGLTSLSVDPCAGSAPISNANLRAVCLAQGAPVGTIGIIEQPSAAQANATTGGNLNLRPEKADSYTIGVVLQPRDLVPGLSITIDYYHIKINDAISQPTVDDAVAACFANLSAASATSANCTQIRRNPDTGGLDGSPATTPGLLLAASNLGTILTDGIDVGANYRRDLGFAKLNLSFQGNWTNRATFKATPTSINRDCVSFYSVNCGSPGSAGPSSAPGSLQPEFTWNQRTTLTFGPADFSLLWRHIDGMKAEPGADQPARYVGPLSGGALNGRTVNFTRIKSVDYFDLATRIGVGDNVDLTLTVTNLFDKDPPLVGGSIGSVSFNSGNTYPSTYDALGRRFAVGARVKF